MQVKKLLENDFLIWLQRIESTGQKYHTEDMRDELLHRVGDPKDQNEAHTRRR